MNALFSLGHCRLASVCGSLALLLGGTAAVAQCPSEASGTVALQAAALRVQSALHADPYFYDRHVDVAIDKNDIVLRGFVFSDWDLADALRISRQAACNWRVINELSIRVGGRR